MTQIGVANQFVQLIREVQTEADLFQIMEEITYEIGFHHFALISHVDLRNPPQNAVRLYNYPETWSESFIEDGLYAHDPVLQASLTRAVGLFGLTYRR
jgi:hypothetical protein